jgi:ribosomal protein L7/L12
MKDQGIEVVAISLVTIALAMFIAIKNRPKQRNPNELPAPSHAVRAFIVEGEKIAAIRTYRKETGASLLEATRVIENHAV